MKTALQIVSIGMISILTGCVTLYKPNTIYSPLLKEKGEFNTSATLGLSGCGLFNLQGSYAISNHTGVLMDGMYHLRHVNSTDTSTKKLDAYFGEIGTGYFNTFGDKKNGLFQCYSGCGYGYTSNKLTYSNSKFNQHNPELNARYFNLFVQPGLAYVSEDFEAAFDLRINYIRLFYIHAHQYEKFDWWCSETEFYSHTMFDFVNLEPTLTLKMGEKSLKGFFQFGVTIPTINSNSYFAANTSSINTLKLIKFSFGLSYTLGR